MSKHKLRRLGVVIGLYVALVLMLFTTSPSKLPIILLIVPFLLMFLVVFISVRLVLQRFFPRLERARQLLIAGCLAGLPSFLLILSSINQLTWRDAFLVIFLVVFLLFYASRINFFKNSG
jgi:uncharacterized membrane protein YccC